MRPDIRPTMLMLIQIRLPQLQMALSDLVLMMLLEFDLMKIVSRRVTQWQID